ncbi:MAG TPA: SH3 domain-containing protein [Burkholderiaceae bacterium]|nr:SH3 domain-containing protein [Burkholderiaceae bacterium]
MNIRALRHCLHLGTCLALGLISALGVPAPAAAEPTERVQVTDAYIEMQTGPGRGYPIFYVAKRDEWIEILLRHTDWYKVRAASGKEGWVHRSQLVNTVTEGGTRKTIREIALDDYLQRRLEMGLGWGRFKTEPMLKLWTGYRLTETLSAEVTVGQVQGVFSGTDYWHLNLNTEPWSDRRLSPFFGIGVGKFKNFANASLVSAAVTNANLANASIGVRYHLSERFVLRADYSFYTAFIADNRTDEFRAATAGLSFFF